MEELSNITSQYLCDIDLPHFLILSVTKIEQKRQRFIYRNL